MASWFSSRKFAAVPTVSAGTCIWSYVFESMNTKSEPSLYRDCMSRLSTVAVWTFVPALNARWTTLPDSRFLSLVRTKAPPLPGLTCWNSTTAQSCPSRLSTRPFLRSLVVATTAEPSRWPWGSTPGQGPHRSGRRGHHHLVDGRREEQPVLEDAGDPLEPGGQRGGVV